MEKHPQPASTFRVDCVKQCAVCLAEADSEMALLSLSGYGASSRKVHTALRVSVKVNG